MLKVYDACNQATAIRSIDEMILRLPFRIQVVQTDNGAEFQSHFHWHLESLEYPQFDIRPRTPHLNGKVERSHRVDDQEFYQILDKGGITDNIHLFNAKLREWQGPLQLQVAHGRAVPTNTVRAGDRQNESGNVTGVLGTCRERTRLGDV